MSKLTTVLITVLMTDYADDWVDDCEVWVGLRWRLFCRLCWQLRCWWSIDASVDASVLMTVWWRQKNQIFWNRNWRRWKTRFSRAIRTSFHVWEQNPPRAPRWGRPPLHYLRLWSEKFFGCGVVWGGSTKLPSEQPPKTQICRTQNFSSQFLFCLVPLSKVNLCCARVCDLHLFCFAPAVWVCWNTFSKFLEHKWWHHLSKGNAISASATFQSVFKGFVH